MNSNPAANDPLVRMMRDTCAQFTDKAQNAGLLAPLLMLIAEAFASLFGKLENIILLWRAGTLPPQPVRHRKPSSTPRAHTPRTRASGKRRTAHRTPAMRQRRARATYPRSGAKALQPSAHRQRIDRYPKSAA